MCLVGWRGWQLSDPVRSQTGRHWPKRSSLAQGAKLVSGETWNSGRYWVGLHWLDCRWILWWIPILKCRELLLRQAKASPMQDLWMKAGCTSELLLPRWSGIVGMQPSHRALLQRFSCLNRVSGLLLLNWWVIASLVQNNMALTCWTGSHPSWITFLLYFNVWKNVVSKITVP